MLIKLSIIINIIAAIFKIVLLPLLPPQTVYALCMLLSWWTVTTFITYIGRKDLSDFIL
jgi:hypothetical protein